jgi:hypothetical protein
MRYWVVSFALLMLAIVTPASAQDQLTFGHTTVGPLTSSGLTANTKRGSKFTPSQAGTVTELCAFMDGFGGSLGLTQVFRLALYSDNAGVPNAKLAETFDMVLRANSSGQWYCGPVGWTPISAVPYWIVVHTGTGTGVARNYFHEPANWYGGNTDDYADGPSEIFGNGGAGNRTLTVYAKFAPASQLRSAGRFTVGNAPSSGLSANFKRGSSFTLTEPGRLSAFSIYLDGNGAGAFDEINEPDFQDYRLALYRDSNGVPGTKVAESGTRTGRGFMRARWHTMEPPSDRVPLEAGKYWVIVHSGSNAEVVRYFADGAPGQWYGNADLFSDGTSSTFGAGSVGNGTLSAFISYQPGSYVTKTFGRTSIGTRPSSGLTANYIRGSRFAIQAPRPDMALTSLNAYLDGNGGAAGSQWIRMAIYQVFQHDGQPTAVPIAMSSDVTIAAGRAPGWVRFPIARLGDHAPDITADWYIMIHSGSPDGVVRFYGDGAANWFGRSQLFDDRGEFAFTGITTGDTTLSVYATYTTKDD